MSDGPLRAACHAEAGKCPGCGGDRLLPAMNSRGQRLCPPCAGLDEDYPCARCGTEWKLVNELCEWCRSAELLDDLLSGDVDLRALRARLLDVARPD